LLLAFLIAGPLAETIFEPLLAVGGPLATSVGMFIGVGPGRGIAPIFVLMGIPPILAAVFGYASRSCVASTQSSPTPPFGSTRTLWTWS
jgi:MFS transporter, DHA3 family, macrolide efflux protein